ncbi:hypothetical protein RJ640_024044 [Escallonia rubra]|uniref:Peptidase A1 domain-containing protein n=1 Tax=Escallonia rubra TaxID=112253 RepID=A0AA88RX17_9ASTE|nr:hypothetical protein RJ640_024044 [Escallonia rubra]
MASLVSTIITTSSAISPIGFETPLIHHDSIFSPFYNATATVTDRADQALKRSVSRLSYLKALTMKETPERVPAIILAGAGSFYVSMSIGEPGVDQLVLMDTGSDHVWVHCIPCVGCNTNNHLFDPSKSSTYYPLPCNHDPYCTAHCDHQKNECTFSQLYADGTFSSGNYAKEKFEFDIPNEGSKVLLNVMFGCGRVVHEPNSEINGVMGLGNGYQSMSRQLGGKFSYCIGNIDDRNNMNNRLILGSGARLLGASTPLDMYNDLYYLKLEGISFDDHNLPISPTVFRRTRRGNGGVLIDSGAELTYLVRDAYEALKSAVEFILNGALARVSVPNERTRLCYFGSLRQIRYVFPVVKFHFSEGAILELDVENVFQVVKKGIICLSVEKVNGQTPGDVSIIGLFMQQNHNIGYDLRAKRIYFKKNGCP